MAAARIKQLEEKLEALQLSSEMKISALEAGLRDARRLTIRRFCASDEDFRFYTQFPSESAFMIFWESIEPSASNLIYWTKAQRSTVSEPTPSPQRQLPLVDELFMYFLRVAAGLKEKLIADLFKVSISTVSRVTITWANYLHLVLGSLPIWLSKEKVRSTMPQKYREYCPTLRVILDCTEVRCESSQSLVLQSETFSTYKNHTTWKSLIGIAPSGLITFVSKLYTGSVTDKELTLLSGVLDLLEPGDTVMVDKGFTIGKMLEEVGASLVIPPFKFHDQFTEEEVFATQEIGQLRTRVENVIRRVKQNHIWDSVVPLTLTGTVNQIWANCCVLANYQGPLSLKD